MVAALQILGDVSESAEVIWILSSAGNVPDLMLRDYSLRGGGSVSDGGRRNPM